MSDDHQKKMNFSLLQIGRGLAAVFVVLFHAGALFDSTEYWGVSVLSGVWHFGYSGVYFFFVLSGFIMLSAHAGDFGRPARVIPYIKKRIIRIYPMYWVVIFPICLFDVFVGSVNVELIPNSVFLIGMSSTAVLGVSWTLFHEMLFYILFGVVIFKPWLGGGLLLIWFCACALLLGSHPQHYSLLVVNLLFGMGMLSKVLAGRWRVGIITLIIGGFLFSLIAIEDLRLHQISDDARILLYGSASAIIVLGCAVVERWHDVRCPWVLLALGDASYAIYLVHYPLLSALGKLCFKMGIAHVVPVTITYAICVLACLVVGGLLHTWIERPLIAYLRGVSGLSGRLTGS